MRRLPIAYLVLVSFCASLPVRAAPAQDIEVYFSPNGGCTEAIVRELAKAKTEIHVQAYSFTSAPIAAALVDASKRGVAVSVILDKSQRTEKYSSADFISRAGIPTLIDAKHAIAHNKIIIIDGKEVLTGSFNFTKSAESSNAENLLVIHRPDLAARYLANWSEHAKHSDKYQLKAVLAPDPVKGASSHPITKLNFKPKNATYERASATA